MWNLTSEDFDDTFLMDTPFLIVEETVHWALAASPQ